MKRGRLSETSLRKVGISVEIGNKTKRSHGLHFPTNSKSLLWCSEGRVLPSPRRWGRKHWWRRNSWGTSNVIQHFQATTICQTDHMMQARLNISFYFCFKIEKIRNMNPEKQNLLQVSKHIQTLAEENTVHRRHLLPGAEETLLTATVPYIIKPTN